MSHFLDTTYKRKSAAITAVIMSLLIVALFFFGLRYLDPPEEYGIAVNFGTSAVGMGDVQPDAPLKAASEEVVEEEQEEVEEVIEEAEPDVTEEISEVAEEVATQETEESIAIKKAAEEKKKADAIVEKKRLEDERIEKEKQAEIAKKKAAEEAKRKKLDAMIGGINNADGTATGGEGNDNTAGDKGKLSGDPYAPSYFGSGGSGNGVGYGLNGRGKPSKSTFKQDCNEYGIVVVRIEVDRSGKVIKATLEAKGSTSTDPCLVDPAKKIALSYKWPADTDAPVRQIGFVSINFEH